MRLKNGHPAAATSLLELTIAMSLIGTIGLAIYSMLNVGMILGAKNAAVNTAHQQARVAMLQLVQDLHSAVSLPALTDQDSVPIVTPPAEFLGRRDLLSTLGRRSLSDQRGYNC
jgi:hypothetical protein